MDKRLLVFCTALALAACEKESPRKEAVETAPKPASELVFDFTVNYPGETRAVKEGWEAGDKVFVFFEGVTTGYVTMSYGQAGWDTPVFVGTAGESDLASDGKCLTAVYLPFGNSATAVYSDGYVQFFIEDANPVDGAYTLGCDAVIPVGVASVAADGTISETTDRTYDEDLTGYAYGNGYLFSGKLSGSYTHYAGYAYRGYYFAKTRVSDNSRADYVVKGKTLESHSAIKLPANDNVYTYTDGIGPNHGKWVPVGEGIPVIFGKFTALSYEHYGSWSTCNYGGSLPEDPGTTLTFDEALSHSTSAAPLPGKGDFEALINRCDWTWMTVHGKMGVIVMYRPDSADETPFGFMFLPQYTYGWGLSYWTGTQSNDTSGYELHVQSYDSVLAYLSDDYRTNTKPVRYHIN